MVLTNLHDETLFMGPPGLFRQLVFQTTALLVQLHHRVLPIFGQDRTLTALWKSRNKAISFQLCSYILGQNNYLKRQRMYIF